LASRFRLPIAAVALISAALAAANIAQFLSDRAAMCVAIGVGVAAATMFFCAVFDMRLQKAVSALNAERRAQARALGTRAARLLGWGLPVGDRLLFAVSLPLLVVGLISANVFNHLAAAALSFAAFFLTVMTNIALTARTYPTDRFMGPFD
jgi:hypothetical protein